jgi:hypothetical protein
MNGTATNETNGHAEEYYVKHHNRNPTNVWLSLQKVIPLQDRDVGFWWHHTGYHVACMIDASGYSIEKQYEVLLFHLLWIVSLLRKLLGMISDDLGSVPDSGRLPRAMESRNGCP